MCLSVIVVKTLRPFISYIQITRYLHLRSKVSWCCYIALNIDGILVDRVYTKCGEIFHLSQVEKYMIYIYTHNIHISTHTLMLTRGCLSGKILYLVIKTVIR